MCAFDHQQIPRHLEEQESRQADLKGGYPETEGMRIMIDWRKDSLCYARSEAMHCIRDRQISGLELVIWRPFVRHSLGHWVV